MELTPYLPHLLAVLLLRAVFQSLGACEYFGAPAQGQSENAGTGSLLSWWGFPKAA